MEADNAPTRQTPPARGGSVEPASGQAVAGRRQQYAREASGERYELRDPFAEVTYRTDKLAEVIAKAQLLGSNRFTAIAADGSRTVLHKVGDEWTRGEQLAPSPQRPLDLVPASDEAPAAPKNGPKQRTNGPAPQHQQPDAKAAARIDKDAERAALVSRLEAALKERYIIKRAPVVVGDVSIGHTEYRFRGDSSRVAFTESTFRLATDTNSPSVARSMVDVAQARNWKGLRIAGSEDFRRMVWLEASVRGVQSIGYEPNPSDLDALKRERDTRLGNRIEPARDGAAGAIKSEKASVRGGGGRKAVVAAIEAVLVAKQVPEAKRAAVLAAATEKLAQRSREGQTPKVKLYDRAAAPQRPAKTLTPEIARAREPTAPAHAR